MPTIIPVTKATAIISGPFHITERYRAGIIPIPKVPKADGAMPMAIFSNELGAVRNAGSGEARNAHAPIPHSCRNIITTSDMPNNGVNVM
jgi:hypothetical protein